MEGEMTVGEFAAELRRGARAVLQVRHAERPKIDHDDPTFGDRLPITEAGMATALRFGAMLAEFKDDVTFDPNEVREKMLQRLPYYMIPAYYVKVDRIPLKPNGKALHIRGYLREFAVTAARTADFYNRVYRLGIPMVGVDPAIVLCYRDEYRKTLGTARGDFVIQMVQEWLLDNLELLKPRTRDENEYYLLAHCTQKSLRPATHDDWVKIFRHASLKLIPIPVGCCGMAGLYGHTAANVARSEAIYRQNWAPVFRKYPVNRCLVTGFSCREQVRKMENAVVRHPLQILNEIM